MYVVLLKDGDSYGCSKPLNYAEMISYVRDVKRNGMEYIVIDLVTSFGV